MIAGYRPNYPTQHITYEAQASLSVEYLAKFRRQLDQREKVSILFFSLQ